MNWQNNREAMTDRERETDPYMMGEPFTARQMCVMALILAACVGILVFVTFVK